ncbi:acetyltransferase, GNAT family [Clostridiales bacterium oral taxon 876 str. F0540]|nr:acetyltransferase, GNAT family [Clostridiales bacterium oral taxon 876 str. F0540]
MDNFMVVKGEVDTAINIMKEVACWGRSIGLNVWKEEYLTREKLMANVKEENFCVGQVSGENACCMILQWQDTFFWPKAKENEAGYIHKLCVRRDYAGMGLSGRLVEFSIEECKKLGIHYLRLDTGWNNKKLCNMYKNLGFELVDKFLLDDGGAFALFEMRI